MNRTDNTEEFFTDAQERNFISRRILADGFQENLFPDEMYIINLSELDPSLRDDFDEIIHGIGLFPSTQDIPREKLCVVSYTYSDESPLDSGIFLTNKTTKKNMLNGLPGSSTEELFGRLFAGITLDKEEHPEYHLCVGNGISGQITKDMSHLEAYEARFLSTLLNYYSPPKREEL